MSYRIYADRVWIMHTCINVLLLFLTAKLSGMTVRVRRVIEIAAGNALCFTAILLLPAPAVLQGEVGIILAGKTFFCLIAALWCGYSDAFRSRAGKVCGVSGSAICVVPACSAASATAFLKSGSCLEPIKTVLGPGGQVSMMQLLVWCAIVVWYVCKASRNGSTGGRNIRSGKSLFSGKRSFFPEAR